MPNAHVNIQSNFFTYLMISKYVQLSFLFLETKFIFIHNLIFTKKKLAKMEVPSSIKFLPNIYAGDEDYEEGFDDTLVINKDVGDCFLCPLCFGIQRNPVVLKNVDMGTARSALPTKLSNRQTNQVKKEHLTPNALSVQAYLQNLIRSATKNSIFLLRRRLI